MPPWNCSIITENEHVSSVFERSLRNPLNYFINGFLVLRIMYFNTAVTIHPRPAVVECPVDAFANISLFSRFFSIIHMWAALGC